MIWSAPFQVREGEGVSSLPPRSKEKKKAHFFFPLEKQTKNPKIKKRTLQILVVMAMLVRVLGPSRPLWASPSPPRSCPSRPYRAGAGQAAQGDRLGDRRAAEADVEVLGGIKAVKIYGWEAAYPSGSRAYGRRSSAGRGGGRWWAWPTR